MNATNSMLHPRLVKEANLNSIIEAITEGGPALYSNYLKPALASMGDSLGTGLLGGYADSLSGLGTSAGVMSGLGSSELLRRNAPNLFKNNPRKARLLEASLAGGLGGAAGLAGLALAKPLGIRTANKSLASRLGSTALITAGLENIVDPMYVYNVLGEDPGALKTIGKSLAGTGLLTAGATVAEQGKLRSAIARARRLKRKAPKSLSFLEQFKKQRSTLPGGTMPGMAALNLMASGSPVLGTAGIGGSLLFNDEVTGYAAKVVDELKKQKKIKDMYKKSSFAAPIVETTKLAAPAYMTTSPRSLEAPTRYKYSNFFTDIAKNLGTWGKNLTKNLGKKTIRGVASRVGGIRSQRNLQQGLSSAAQKITGAADDVAHQFGGQLRKSLKAPVQQTSNVADDGLNWWQRTQKGFSQAWDEGSAQRLQRTENIGADAAQARVQAAKVYNSPAATTAQRQGVVDDALADYYQTARTTNPVTREGEDLLRAGQASQSRRELTQQVADPTRRARETITSTEATYDAAGNLVPGSMDLGNFSGNVDDYEKQVRNYVNQVETQYGSLSGDRVPQYIRNQIDQMDRQVGIARGQMLEDVGEGYYSQMRAQLAPDSIPTAGSAPPLYSKPITQLDDQISNLTQQRSDLANQLTNPAGGDVVTVQLQSRIRALDDNLADLTNTRQQALSSYGEAAGRQNVSRLNAPVQAPGQYAGAPEYLQQSRLLQQTADDIAAKVDDLQASIPVTNNPVIKSQQQAELQYLQGQQTQLADQVSQAQATAARMDFGGNLTAVNDITSVTQGRQVFQQTDDAIRSIDDTLNRANLSQNEITALTNRKNELTATRSALVDRQINVATLDDIPGMLQNTSSRKQQAQSIIDDLSGNVTQQQRQQAASKLQEAERLEAQLLTRQDNLQRGVDSANQTSALSQSRSKLDPTIRNRDKQTFGAGGGVDNVQMLGAESNVQGYVQRNNLLPEGYSQIATKKDGRKLLKDSGLEDALNAIEAQADVEMLAKYTLPDNLEEAVSNTLRSIYKSPGALDEQNIVRNLQSVGLEDDIARSIARESITNTGVQQARRDLSIANELFKTEVSATMNKGYGKLSDKIVKNVDAQIRKANITPESEAQVRGVMTALQNSGVAQSPQGSTMLAMLQDSIPSGPESVQRAVDDITAVMQGRRLTVTTSGKGEGVFTKLFGGGKARQGSLQLSDDQISSLGGANLVARGGSRVDVSKGFKAENIDQLQRHFTDPALASTLSDKVVKTEAGKGAVNKLLSGNATVAKMSPDELSALSIQPFQNTVKVKQVLGAKSVGKSTSELQAEIGKKLKGLDSKINRSNDPAEIASLTAQKQGLDDLVGELNQHSDQVQSTLDNYTNAVREARVNYSKSGGTTGYLEFSGQVNPATSTFMETNLPSVAGLPATLGFGAAATGAVGYGAMQPTAASYGGMQATASFGTSPLAAPVVYMKKSAMDAPMNKFKANEIPKVPKSKVVESPLTSTKLHSFLNAPVM